MNKWRLPTALRIGAVDFAIRTDYRVILGIFRVLTSDEYDECEKWLIALKSFYKDDLPEELTDDAIEQMCCFFNGGSAIVEKEDRKQPKLMDWDQDANILIPAVNKVAGYDVRGMEYLHWWTFLSFYTEVGEGTFATVVAIRKKMATGKKLEKYEKDFVRDNPDMVFLKDAERRRQDEEDKAALAAIGL